MINLTGTRRFVPEADGNRELPEDQRVSLDVRPPRVRDMLEIQRLAREAGGDLSLASVDGDPAQAAKLWAMIEVIIGKHTANWSGVLLADGRPAVDPAEVLAACGLAQVALMSEVAREVIDAGQGTAGEAKNSGSPPGPTSSGSGATAGPASSPA